VIEILILEDRMSCCDLRLSSLLCLYGYVNYELVLGFGEN
jgi:hypothetical protein